MIDTKPLSITEVQNRMQAMLIRHVPISNADNAIPDIVNNSDRLTAEQHLSIYRQSYIARLRACMQAQFKCLDYALGESLFRDFTDQYLDSNPSTSYTLNDLGKEFSLFLTNTRPDADMEEKEEWPDFMIELAAFEYALSEIFDMHETKVSDIPDYNTPNELLIAAPSLHLFEHRFPICQYYLDFSAGHMPQLPFPQQSYSVVSRQNYKLGLFNIGIDQFHFLRFIKLGVPVAEAKEKLIAMFNFKKEDLDTIWPIWRKNFIASGFLVKVGS
jgi:hypothetical protein